MTAVRVDRNRLAPDVAPADDAAIIVGHELRIAEPDVPRDERGRFVDGNPSTKAMKRRSRMTSVVTC